MALNEQTSRKGKGEVYDGAMGSFLFNVFLSYHDIYRPRPSTVLGLFAPKEPWPGPLSRSPSMRHRIPFDESDNSFRAKRQGRGAVSIAHPLLPIETGIHSLRLADALCADEPRTWSAACVASMFRLSAVVDATAFPVTYEENIIPFPGAVRCQTRPLSRLHADEGKRNFLQTVERRPHPTPPPQELEPGDPGGPRLGARLKDAGGLAAEAGACQYGRYTICVCVKTTRCTTKARVTSADPPRPILFYKLGYGTGGSMGE
ncbi:hypothetical protein F5Y19DRAFT_480800 [Xylariaceae sp. FL1651]|nr:hypothetical protein F5Y19DRAFT_480800 [Xylariaceae sp. FL1651]